MDLVVSWTVKKQHLQWTRLLRLHPVILTAKTVRSVRTMARQVEWKMKNLRHFSETRPVAKTAAKVTKIAAKAAVVLQTVEDFL